MIIALLALACTPETTDSSAVPQPGTGQACLAGDPALTGMPALTDGLHTYEFAGTVTFEGERVVLGEALDCNREHRRLVEVLDDDGNTWEVTWAIADESGADRTPTMDVGEGDRVEVLYRHEESFGVADGFAVSDDRGLVAAMEVGTWGPALQEGDVPGLTVGEGESLGEELFDCGTVERTELWFTAASSAGVAPFGSAGIVVGDEEATAWAISSYHWQDDLSCTDLAGEVTWGVWR